MHIVVPINDNKDHHALLPTTHQTHDRLLCVYQNDRADHPAAHISLNRIFVRVFRLVFHGHASHIFSYKARTIMSFSSFLTHDLFFGHISNLYLYELQQQQQQHIKQYL